MDNIREVSTDFLKLFHITDNDRGLFHINQEVSTDFLKLSCTIDVSVNVNNAASIPLNVQEVSTDVPESFPSMKLSCTIYVNVNANTAGSILLDMDLEVYDLEVVRELFWTHSPCLDVNSLDVNNAQELSTDVNNDWIRSRCLDVCHASGFPERVRIFFFFFQRWVSD